MEFSSKTSLFHLLLLLLCSITHLPPSLAATKERCHPHDKRALLQIKQQSFNNSAMFDSWTPTSDCFNGWISVDCDANNCVNSLIIFDTDTTGTPFPTALGHLPYVQQVIFQNIATGPIPHSLANLRHIVLLDLSFNRLTGSIPDFFAHFKNLSNLDLTGNNLSGSIPSAPALAPNLRNLDLSSNRLTGPVSERFGSFKNEQFDLNLSGNKLSGELPRSLENMNFFSFKVAGNRLKGVASFLFRKNNITSSLDLSWNSFSFDMSDLEFPTMLSALDLSHNKIYGGLPAGLGDLPYLYLLNVSYNRLCGPVPTGGLPKQFDATAYFCNKCLCGSPLPPCK